MIVIMNTDGSQRQAQIEGLREAVAELESMQESGEMPSGHGIGDVSAPLSFEERLIMTRKKLTEVEAES